MTSNDESLFVGPDDGLVLTNPIGGRMVLKASEQASGGAYSLHKNILPPHSPDPRPHIHHNHDEAFYVLEGELTMRAGTRTIPIKQGIHHHARVLDLRDQKRRAAIPQAVEADALRQLRPLQRGLEEPQQVARVDRRAG